MMSSLTTRPARPPADADPLRPRPPAGPDWPKWTRTIERKRRLLTPPSVWPGWVYREGTRASFRLEGIDVTDADVADALSSRLALRSRRVRRVRAHLAVLRSLDHGRRLGQRLTAVQVVRWYTTISGGLSTAALAIAGHERLAAAVRRINSPQRRLQPAVVEAARLHAELLADPMFPGFNAILARLLLHAHLASSGLPPVVFDPARDAWPEPTATAVTATLLERIDGSLERLGE